MHRLSLNQTPPGERIPSRRIGKFEIRYTALTPIEPRREYICELFEDRVGSWMSNDNAERKAMKFALDVCEGRVLIGGLGLGVVAEELAKKDSVTEIVVVERAQEVIDLVWDYIDTRGKGRLVKDDLFHYLETTTDTFDYMYSDIHPDSGSAKAYTEILAPLRRLAEKRLPSNRILMCEEDKMRKLYIDSTGGNK